MKLGSIDSAITRPSIHSAIAPAWTREFRGQSTWHQLCAEVLMVVGGTLLLSLLAQIRIPMVPVPITGQTLGVLLIGAALGARRGAVSVVLYWLLGLAGAPVFAVMVGPAAFVHFTAGYLIAFLPAVMAVGFLAERRWDRTVPGALATFLIGHAIIFALGIAWLAYLQGLEAAIIQGFLPFIPGMVIKTAIATALLPWAWAISPMGKSKEKSKDE